MPELARIVVAGAGLAGLRAAQAARQAGFGGELVLIGAEPHPPYNRPPLSKELLAGERTPEECAFPGLEAIGAEVRLGVAATGLDAAARRLALSDGGTLAYDRLVLATGVRARRWPKTESMAAVHVLRDLDDARGLSDALEGTAHLAIVGAGFVGCEVAASARSRGLAVTLVDVLEQPLVPLGAELGARCAELHREHGVTLRLGVGVREIGPDGVELADGTAIAADRVLVALGAVPNTEWLAGSGIDLTPDGGVLCDATLTSVGDPDVLAAGDLAAWPATGGLAGEPVRVEHWTTAAEHGRLAGQNATRPVEDRIAHVAPPYFWSDQYGARIQAVGFPGRAERMTIVEEDAEGAAGIRIVAEAHDAGGELVGAVTINHARRLADYRRRLAATHV